MKEGESVEDVDIDIDIPARILDDVLQGPQAFSGDAAHNLQEYCTWVLAQVQSNRWRKELEVAIKFAIDQYLDLNSIVKHPHVIINAMVQGRVKLGSALQFTGNVDRFRKEGKNL
ncbi:unnamed protein product [Clonostachys rosea f. rosea IK726]|uniref:Uncharacterized protein n=1 Tax=Clonostachys rosea f. rosea IK726 TaxID=1349383 RepID=A0ACA9TXN6_BIOOC|nr:unnamed protein product [Clonostachys rosea f. rosea IK726]